MGSSTGCERAAIAHDEQLRAGLTVQDLDLLAALLDRMQRNVSAGVVSAGVATEVSPGRRDVGGPD